METTNISQIFPGAAAVDAVCVAIARCMVGDKEKCLLAEYLSILFVHPPAQSKEYSNKHDVQINIMGFFISVVGRLITDDIALNSAAPQRSISATKQLTHIIVCILERNDFRALTSNDSNNGGKGLQGIILSLIKCNVGLAAVGHTDLDERLLSACENLSNVASFVYIVQTILSHNINSVRTWVEQAIEKRLDILFAADEATETEITQMLILCVYFREVMQGFTHHITNGGNPNVGDGPVRVVLKSLSPLVEWLLFNSPEVTAELLETLSVLHGLFTVLINQSRSAAPCSGILSLLASAGSCISNVCCVLGDTAGSVLMDVCGLVRISLEGVGALAVYCPSTEAFSDDLRRYSVGFLFMLVDAAGCLMTEIEPLVAAEIPLMHAVLTELRDGLLQSELNEHAEGQELVEKLTTCLQSIVSVEGAEEVSKTSLVSALVVEPVDSAAVRRLVLDALNPTKDGDGTKNTRERGQRQSQWDFCVRSKLVRQAFLAVSSTSTLAAVLSATLIHGSVHELSAEASALAADLLLQRAPDEQLAVMLELLRSADGYLQDCLDDRVATDLVDCMEYARSFRSHPHSSPSDTTSVVQLYMDLIRTVLESEKFDRACIECGDKDDGLVHGLLLQLSDLVMLMLVDFYLLVKFLEECYLYAWGEAVLLSCHRLLDVASFVALIEKVNLHERSLVRSLGVHMLEQRLASMDTTEGEQMDAIMAINEKHIEMVHSATMNITSDTQIFALTGPVIAALQYIPVLASYFGGCGRTDTVYQAQKNVTELLTALLALTSSRPLNLSTESWDHCLDLLGATSACVIKLVTVLEAEATELLPEAISHIMAFWRRFVALIAIGPTTQSFSLDTRLRCADLIIDAVKQATPVLPAVKPFVIELFPSMQVLFSESLICLGHSEFIDLPQCQELRAVLSDCVVALELSEPAEEIDTLTFVSSLVVEPVDFAAVRRLVLVALNPTKVGDGTKNTRERGQRQSQWDFCVRSKVVRQAFLAVSPTSTLAAVLSATLIHGSVQELSAEASALAAGLLLQRAPDEQLAVMLELLRSANRWLQLLADHNDIESDIEVKDIVASIAGGTADPTPSLSSISTTHLTFVELMLTKEAFQRGCEACRVEGDLSEVQQQHLRTLTDLVLQVLMQENVLFESLEEGFLPLWGETTLRVCGALLKAPFFSALILKCTGHECSLVSDLASCLLEQRLQSVSTGDETEALMLEGLSEQFHNSVRAIADNIPVGAELSAPARSARVVLRCVSVLADWLNTCPTSNADLPKSLQAVADLVTELAPLAPAVVTEVYIDSWEAWFNLMRVGHRCSVELIVALGDHAASMLSIIAANIVATLNHIGALLSHAPNSAVPSQDQRVECVRLACSVLSNVRDLVAHLGEKMRSHTPSLYLTLIKLRNEIRNAENDECATLITNIAECIHCFEDAAYERVMDTQVRPSNKYSVKKYCHAVCRDDAGVYVCCGQKHYVRGRDTGTKNVRVKGVWKSNGYFLPDLHNFYTHYANEHCVEKLQLKNYVTAVEIDRMVEAESCLGGYSLRTREETGKQRTNETRLRFNGVTQQALIESTTERKKTYAKDAFFDLFAYDDSKVDENYIELDEETVLARANGKRFYYECIAENDVAPQHVRSETAERAGAITHTDTNSNSGSNTGMNVHADGELVAAFDAKVGELAAARAITERAAKTIIAQQMVSTGAFPGLTADHLRFKAGVQKLQEKTRWKLDAAYAAVQSELCKASPEYSETVGVNPVVRTKESSAAAEDYANILNNNATELADLFEHKLQVKKTGALFSLINSTNRPILPAELIIPFADPLAGTSQYAWALKINIRALAECNASTAVSAIRERALRVVHSAFMLRKHGASEDVPALVLQAVDDFYGTVIAEPTHSNFKFPGPIDATQFARTFALGQKAEGEAAMGFLYDTDYFHGSAQVEIKME